MRNQQVQELNRFLHYYTRFRNHENSQHLEEPLLTNVRQKMELLASSLGRGGARPGEELAEKGTRFVEDGVRELLKARRVLCGSYVYGYYLEDNGYNKTIFEFMQNELEEVTEKLSEQVARPYLRTPRSLIIQTTALARRKRHEFVRAVAKGLIPPETPPTLRKEQMSHAIAASLKDLDPNNPWVKDSRGRHTNLSAIYDWPDFDSDEEESEVSRALAVSLLGECSRAGCGRPRARNPRTAAVHEFCSLRCSQAARLAPEDLYQVNVTADYNMDLVIALEMSRLQMIEDEMKKRQRAAEDASQGNVCDSGHLRPPGTSLAGTSGGNGMQEGTVNAGDDHQLKLAIQLSLQENQLRSSNLATSSPGQDDLSVSSSGGGGGVEENDNTGNDGSLSTYHKTSADLTVDYFLKSLAGRHIDLKNFSPCPSNNVFSSPEEGSVSGGGTVWGCGLSKTLTDKELLLGGCGFKPCVAEDGRFEIGDIHENGCFNDVDEYEEVDARLLKRSHSTGDLCTRGRRGPRLGVGTNADEPRYHLDSDHSSQHEEKPEDLVKRMLACPASTGGCSSGSRQWSGTSGGGSRGGHFLLLHQQSSSGGTVGGGEASNTSEDGTSLYFGGQSSVEDTTTTSDSLNADLEVCGILGTTTEDDEEGKADMEEDSLNGASTKHQNEFLHSIKDVRRNVAEKSRSCGNVATSVGTSIASKTVTGISLLEAHRKAFKASGGKGAVAASGSGLRIRICKSPNPGCGGSESVCRQLETDSSNEYESETGIPKSPTLFISGVSISRTPEPRSPALAVANAVANASAGRQSRSSSLTVPPPPPLNTVSAGATLGSSSISLNAGLLPAASPEPQRAPTPVSVTPPPPPLLPPPPGSPAGSCHTRSGAPSPILTASNGNAANSNIPPGTAPTKSKSASEPEREREMFRFPKSSTDGALSSVLHVQESNLSSDDFHEALFLLERSPKGSGSKRRKKSKKDRNKDKENNGGGGIVATAGVKGKEVKEASSAL